MQKRTICPTCGRRTVVFAMRRNMEDNYYCTWRRWKADGCDFFFFTLSGMQVDKDNEARWELANRGA